MPKEYRTISRGCRSSDAGTRRGRRHLQRTGGNRACFSGEKRRCKVLEIDGGNALVQLFENSTGINLIQQ